MIPRNFSLIPVSNFSVLLSSTFDKMRRVAERSQLPCATALIESNQPDERRCCQEQYPIARLGDIGDLRCERTQGIEPEGCLLAVINSGSDDLASVVDAVSSGEVPAGLSRQQGIQVNHGSVQQRKGVCLLVPGSPGISDDSAGVVDPVGIALRAAQRPEIVRRSVDPRGGLSGLAPDYFA